MRAEVDTCFHHLKLTPSAVPPLNNESREREREKVKEKEREGEKKRRFIAITLCGNRRKSAEETRSATGHRETKQKSEKVEKRLG